MSKTTNSFAIEDGQTVVFIGDSITDCGRRNQAYPLGEGYVHIVNELITARYPGRKIRFINRGISGDIIKGLARRWHEDVEAHNPDWVSVLIGINDIHRRFWMDKAEYISPEQYYRIYHDCLNQTKDATQARLVLLDPFYICGNPKPNSEQQEVSQVLPDYLAVVNDLSEKFGAIHVPLHEIFQKQLQYRPAEIFCPEPVHPNPTGHLIIAHAWLTALGW